MTLRQLQRFQALMPELRAEERIAEATIALLPYQDTSARRKLLRMWTDRLPAAEPSPQTTQRFDRAWDSLRLMVRRN